MRRLLTLILLLVALPAGAGLFDSRPGASLGGGLDGGDFLKVDQAFKPSVERSDAQHVLLRFVNAEGYYLYRHRFQFKVEPAQVSLGQVQLPAGKQHHDEYFGDTEVYYNIVDLEIPLNNPARQPYTLVVTYQGCADKGLCYPPETRRFDIDGGAATPATNDAASKDPLEHKGKRSLLFFFLAGLTLTFTPCVLPMLPILSGVVLRGRPGGGRGFVLSLAYVLPMALCFALLGALMGMFGASLNLQAQLQSPWVLVPFAAFFALFAVAMFGFFELRLPGFIREPLDRLAGDARGGSILGAATLGVLSSLLVSPCVSAPLAASLLYISASGDAWGGGLQLFALGLGMGTPLVVFGAGGGALLPKSGAWMNGVRNAFGVLLLAVAVWLLERVVSGPVALMLWGMLAGGAGLALGALEFTPKSAVRRLLQLLGLMFLTYAVAAWIGALQGESDPIHPLGRSVPSIHAGPPSTPGEWQNLTTPAQLDAALAEARQAGKPVLLDWYADWCISCKVIERQVLTDPTVQARQPAYRLLRFDITESNPAQRGLLDRYNLFGPPAILFFAPGGDEWSDLRVIGEIDAAGLAERLRRAATRQ
ncbi:TPA: protein-disulfide reductase DsbD [Pseudomonas aeruginosa]|nr:protein-disulfide reductase DsbD [Pseudomonas aeruginosa]